MVGVKHLVFTILLLVSAAGFAGDVKFKVVTDLDVFEPFDAHVFHDGLLWVGRSRKNLGADYHIQVFDSAGTPVFTKPLEHSARYLYPYGANGVLTIGVSYKDNMTYFSTIERKSGKFSVTTKKIPLGAYGNEWAGKPGLLYFMDPGGFDAGEPIGQPLRTIFTLRGNSFNYLAPRIPGPHHPLYVGNQLFLIEHPTVASGGRYLSLVNLNQAKPERLYTGQDLSKIVALDNNRLLAIADRDANEVIIFDIASKKVLRKVAIEAGSPQSIAVLGKCIVAGSENTKRLVFFQWATGQQIAEWDLSVVGDKLIKINSVAADAATGRVYVRANYPAQINEVLKSEDRNSVVLVEEADHAVRDKCK